MWPSGKLAAKLQRGRRITPRYLFFSLCDLAWEKWLDFASLLPPCCLGLEADFCMVPQGMWQGRHLGAGSQTPSPNTRVCANCTSSLMLWKRKPTEINIDISRVMKQLQSWFRNVSPYFMACLHLQRRYRGGETSLLSHLQGSLLFYLILPKRS